MDVPVTQKFVQIFLIGYMNSWFTNAEYKVIANNFLSDAIIAILFVKTRNLSNVY